MHVGQCLERAGVQVFCCFAWAPSGSPHYASYSGFKNSNNPVSGLQASEGVRGSPPLLFSAVQVLSPRMPACPELHTVTRLVSERAGRVTGLEQRERASEELLPGPGPSLNPAPSFQQA